MAGILESLADAFNGLYVWLLGILACLTLFVVEQRSRTIAIVTNKRTDTCRVVRGWGRRNPFTESVQRVSKTGTLQLTSSATTDSGHTRTFTAFLKFELEDSLAIAIAMGDMSKETALAERVQQKFAQLMRVQQGSNIAEIKQRMLTFIDEEARAAGCGNLSISAQFV